MKLLLSILFSVSALSFIQAQDCKPILDSKDEFTGITQVFYGGKLREDLVASDKNQVVNLYFGKYGDSLLLQISITKVVEKDDIRKWDDEKECMKINAGQNLFFVFDDGSNLQFQASSDSKVEKRKVLSSLNITTSVGYYLTKEQYEQFAKSGIKKLRLELAACTSMIVELRDKKKLKFLEMFQCAKPRLIP